MLTFMPLEEIAEYEKLEGSQLNRAKEVLAFEVTKLIHGEEEAEKAQNAANALFGTGSDTSNMPSTELSADNFTDGKIGILDLLVLTKLAPSKGEARRLIQQGGISIDEEKIQQPTETLSLDEMKAKGQIIIKKGKKVFHKVTVL